MKKLLAILLTAGFMPLIAMQSKSPSTNPEKARKLERMKQQERDKRQQEKRKSGQADKERRNSLPPEDQE